MMAALITAVTVSAIAIPLFLDSDDNRDTTQTSTNSSTTTIVTNSSSTTTTIVSQTSNSTLPIVITTTTKRDSQNNITIIDDNQQSIEISKLYQFALNLINTHRLEANVTSVELGDISSAQDHAEDLASMCVISHWDSGGMKPYMRYGLAGGEGVIAENVAVSWWHGPFTFTELLIMETIEELEFSMMYDDADSDWGHRDNIINPIHNKVHIGIALGSNCIIYVEHFEDDYLDLTRYLSIDNSSILHLSGVITTSLYELSSLDSKSTTPIINKNNQTLGIQIAFDPFPVPLTAEELETTPNSYGLGDLAGTILKPLPPNWYYPDLENTVIIGTKWEVSIQGNNTFFDITANIQPIIDVYGIGVYTISLLNTYYNPIVKVIEISIFVENNDWTNNCQGFADCFIGVVTKIRDGDTIEVDGKAIRLALVDTPEEGKPGYGEATAFTTSLCPIDSLVLVDQDDGQPFDIYNRTLAVVYCINKNLNAELMYSGNAVINTYFCEDSEFRNENWAKIEGC
ncbi:thermonuclease family protein [Thermoproteota archaeon]